MAKREKKPRPDRFEDDDEEHAKQSKPPIVLSISDDDEANEDLSLKIVEKAMSRASSNAGKNDAGNHVVIDLTSPSLSSPEAVAELKEKKKKTKGKKKRSNAIETQVEAINIMNEEEEKANTDKADELEKSMEPNPVQTSDNSVLRKLLRGPRYFDPPDSSWGACYNCGEQGHTSANCTSSKWNKPCFVCGSLEHKGRQCTKGQDCFICKKGGHRAKDCPEKYRARSQNDKICLKCGDFGHDMFFCENKYSLDDLKEIQCYICKSFGHLCCAYSNDSDSREVSCYRCGQLGHTGLECGTSRGETTTGWLPSSSRGEATTGWLPSSCYKCGEEGHFARECVSSAKGSGTSRGETTTGWLPDASRGETTTGWLPSSCYKCGEEGHFARECVSSAKGYTTPQGDTTSGRSPSSCYKCGGGGHFAREFPSSVSKVRKRSHDQSSPTRRYPNENSDYVGVRSAPHDLGKSIKRKKPHHEGGFTMPSKQKQRGGWITEDPGDLPHRKSKMNRWQSPATPNNTMNNSFHLNNSGHASSFRFFTETRKLHYGTPTSNGSAYIHQQRFSTPRFGNSSSDGMRRNYDW